MTVGDTVLGPVARGRAFTTDATPAELLRWTVPVGSSSIVEVSAAAVVSGGDTLNVVARFIVSRDTLGTVFCADLGTASRLESGSAAWTLTIAADSADAVVSATGAAAHSIQWFGIARLLNGAAGVNPEPPGYDYASTHCVESAGALEHVTFGNIAAYEYNVPFSVSFWLKTSYAGWGAIVSKELTGTTARGWEVNTNGGLLGFWLTNDYTGGNYIYRTLSATVNDGAWHHICCTSDGSAVVGGLAMYVDGAPAATVSGGTLSGTIVTAQALMAMSRAAAGGWAQGRICHLAIHNRKLSGAEVTWAYNGGVTADLLNAAAPSGLAFWWPMGTGDTFPTLDNAAGLGSNGTMTNMAAGDIVADYP